MAVDAGRLTDFATAILAHAGKDAGRAAKVAARLVGANLAGHDSHGVGMIPAYVDGILAGQLDAAADIELVQDKGRSSWSMATVALAISWQSRR